MIQITPHMRILVAVEPIDFRAGIDGLLNHCRKLLWADSFSGVLFVFGNRARTALKVLVYDGQGFWMCHKRLSTGKFTWWPAGHEQGRTLYAGIERCLGHEPTNQVVGQQMNPHLFLIHLWSLTTEHVHAQGGLDVAQVEFHVPVLPVQLGQFGLSNLAVIEHRGNQDLAVDLDFPHSKLIREGLVMLLRHPLWAGLRLRSVHQVIVFAQSLAAMTIGDARAVLFEQNLYAGCPQRCAQEVIAIEGIG